MTTGTGNGWRDSTRVGAARAGIAAARRTLEIVRDGDRYTVAGKTFNSWHDASEYVLSQPIKGEA